MGSDDHLDIFIAKSGRQSKGSGADKAENEGQSGSQLLHRDKRFELSNCSIDGQSHHRAKGKRVDKRGTECRTNEPRSRSQNELQERGPCRQDRRQERGL